MAQWQPKIEAKWGYKCATHLLIWLQGTCSKRFQLAHQFQGRDRIQLVFVQFKWNFPIERDLTKIILIFFKTCETVDYIIQMSSKTFWRNTKLSHRLCGPDDLLDIKTCKSDLWKFFLWPVIILFWIHRLNCTSNVPLPLWSSQRLTRRVN